MDSRQRVYAVVGGEKPDRRPFTALLSLYGSRLVGCPTEEFYRNARAYSEGQEAVFREFRPDILWAPFKCAGLGNAHPRVVTARMFCHSASTVWETGLNVVSCSSSAVVLAALLFLFLVLWDIHVVTAQEALMAGRILHRSLTAVPFDCCAAPLQNPPCPSPQVRRPSPWPAAAVGERGQPQAHGHPAGAGTGRGRGGGRGRG